MITAVSRPKENLSENEICFDDDTDICVTTSGISMLNIRRTYTFFFRHIVPKRSTVLLKSRKERPQYYRNAVAAQYRKEGPSVQRGPCYCDQPFRDKSRAKQSSSASTPPAPGSRSRPAVESFSGFVSVRIRLLLYIRFLFSIGQIIDKVSDQAHHGKNISFRYGRGDHIGIVIIDVQHRKSPGDQGKGRESGKQHCSVTVHMPDIGPIKTVCHKNHQHSAETQDPVPDVFRCHGIPIAGHDP